MKSDDKRGKAYTALDLLKTRNMRKISLILWYSLIVLSLTYYGFSFNMSSFGGNFYITFMLSGLIEVPSQPLTALALRFIGRRHVFAMFMLLTAFSSFAVIPATSESLKIIFALLGKFGVNSAWNVWSMQCAELYPTVLRHTGKGVASVVGLFG